MMRVRPGLEYAHEWTEFCSVVVHERGHTAGLRFPENPGDPLHSPDPRHNMFSGSVGDALGPPHASVCGPTEAELDLRDEARALRQDIRRLRRAARRAHGAKRRRLSARARRYERDARRLRRELRSLSRRLA